MKYLLALALAAVPLTAAADTVRQACLKGRSEERIAIDLTKGRYIEGNIEFSRLDLSRGGVSLSAVSDTAPERKLFGDQTNRQDFLLWYPQGSRVWLKLSAPGNRHMCYRLTLKQSAAHYDETVRENAVPQSPRLQQLQRETARQGSRAEQRFWAEIRRQGTPLVEKADGGTACSLSSTAVRHTMCACSAGRRMITNGWKSCPAAACGIKRLKCATICG